MLAEIIKWILLVFAGLYTGMGWNAFWKTIDYMLREWVKKHPVPGEAIEMMIDLLHHTKIAVLILVWAYWMLFPEPIGVFLICFALGWIMIDAPREKQRILNIITKIMKGESIEKEVTEIVEEITGREEEVDKADEELAKQLLESVSEGSSEDNE